MAKKNNYFQVPNDIFDRAITINANGKQRNLSAIEKLVYIYICRCSNNTDTAFPSYTTIANKCNIGRSSAINAIKVLAENEFIKKTWRKNPDATDNKKNHTNEYIISSGPSDTPVNNKNNASGIFDTPPSPPDTPPLVQEIDLGGPSDTPRRITTYKEPIKEEPIKKKSGKKNADYFGIVNLIYKFNIKSGPELKEEDFIIPLRNLELRHSDKTAVTLNRLLDNFFSKIHYPQDFSVDKLIKVIDET